MLSATTFSCKLVRDGDEFVDPVQMMLSQVTPRTVSTLFSISEDTVWLREQGGQRAFFPNLSKTSFDLPNDVGVLIAMGINQESTGFSGTRPQHTPLSSTPVIGASTRPMSCPGRPIFSKRLAQAGGASVNVKVVQVITKDGKSTMKSPKFAKTGEQLFVPVKESTANVNYVTSIVRENWGSNYVLITADGLKLHDSPGTQGLRFWRVGSRKIFAVPQEQLSKLGGSKGKGRADKPANIIDISSSDEEEETLAPSSKKRKLSTDPVMNEIKCLRKDIDDVMKLSKGMSIPPGLYKQLKDTFRCHICHSTPFQVPAIFGRCCRNILGCSKCLDKWFQKESTCPLCRSDRALPDTCIINGLDNFISSIDPLLKDVADNAHPQENARPQENLDTDGTTSGVTVPLPPAQPVHIDSDSDFEQFNI